MSSVTGWVIWVSNPGGMWGFFSSQKRSDLIWTPPRDIINGNRGKLDIHVSVHHHHHHHHISVMELDHLLTRSGLTYPEVSSKVCHDSFCQLGNSVACSTCFEQYIRSSSGPSNLLLEYLNSSWYILYMLHSTMDKFWCSKGKAIPLRAWTGPEGCRRLRLPDFKTIGT